MRETAGSNTIARLQSLTCQFDTLIVAGLPEKKGNQYFKMQSLWIKNGLKTCYLKISQTNIDRQYLSRGTKPVVFEHMGIRFGYAGVCKAGSRRYSASSQVCPPTGEYLLKLEDQEETATTILNIDSETPKKVIGVNLIDEMNAITKILKTNNKES